MRMPSFLSAVFGNASEAQLLPQTRLSGPMPWMIAIMILLSVIVAATGLALRRTADQVRSDIAGGITVQIVHADKAVREAQAAAVVRRLKAMRSVQAVRRIPDAELSRLIDPWLATAGSEADQEPGAATLESLPVPALIDARLQQGTGAAQVAVFAKSVRMVAPAARVDAQGSWLQPVFEVLSTLQWLSLMLIGLLGIATVAAVVLSSRATLNTHRETIEIVHLLGGTDGQIARIFQRRVGLDAALGGLLGLGGAALVVSLLGRQVAAMGSGLGDAGGLLWPDWLLLALIPVAGALLAVLTARFTVMRTLGRMV